MALGPPGGPVRLPRGTVRGVAAAPALGVAACRGGLLRSVQSRQAPLSCWLIRPEALVMLEGIADLLAGAFYLHTCCGGCTNSCVPIHLTICLSIFNRPSIDVYDVLFGTWASGFQLHGRWQRPPACFVFISIVCLCGGVEWLSQGIATPLRGHSMGVPAPACSWGCASQPKATTATAGPSRLCRTERWG